MQINTEKLREFLIDYYGSAAFAGMPVALMGASKAERASAEELIQIAMQESIDLSKFSE